MKCNAKPYEGNDAYVFVSYSRKDAGIVYPLIERLASEGVRIWYDSGIHGGEIWPEVIANHLKNSVCCLVFMSNNAVQSHNCYSELIFAVEMKKPLIPIRYDDAQLTLGMRMMVGVNQWIEITGAPTKEEIDRILSLELIKPAHGIVDRSITIQNYQLKGETEPQKGIIWDPTPVPPEKPETPVTPERPVPPEKPVSNDEQSKLESDNLENRSGEQKGAISGEETTPDTMDDYEDIKTIADTVDIRPTIIIVSEEGSRMRGKIGATILGRSKTKSDIVIADPDRKISGRHVRIVSFDGMNTVEDLNSTNGTWVDGVRLAGEQKMPVENYCELILHKRRVFVAFDQWAEKLWQVPALLSLRCEETGESKYLWDGELRLGRNYPWKEGVFQSNKTSHDHAMIMTEKNGFVLMDTKSTNGTWLNGEKLEGGRQYAVSTGDIIQIEKFHFIANVITFSGGGSN